MNTETTQDNLSNLKSVKSFDINTIRAQFPILKQTLNGKSLVYFDNAATTQKPLSVINAISEYYETINSNVHRGIHTLSEKATEAYENSREKARSFVNAESKNEIVFVKGTTDGINLAASSFGNMVVGEGGEVIVSQMEHHSNMVPWQNLCSRKNAELKYIPVNDAGELMMDEFKEMINEKTKLISVVYISNTLGTINPVKEIIEIAHSRNIPVVIDAAQAAPHLKIDVKELDCDFLAFSGHKIYGPTGIGILYGKEKHLESMPPYQYGGEMIKSVSYDKTEFNVLPYKFEAGTPNIAGAIVQGAAIDFIEKLGHENIHNAEMKLLDHANKLFDEIGGIRIIGTAKNKTSVISFIIDGVHPYDTGSILDNLGIAVRTGFHCTQPLIEQRFKLPGTVRASFAVYNTNEEIDKLAEGLKKNQNNVFIMNTKTIQEREDQIVDDFSLFDDWMMKYEHIIELGKNLPIIDEKYKNESYEVKGCQSKVWLNAELKDGLIFYKADSDAIITKGIISLLINVLSGNKPEDIINADMNFINAIGLKEHLSPNRANGLTAMINYMKNFALTYSKENVNKN